ncbi:hypothetical protein Hanom_Chr00s138745g01818241 [Helianthus anomalus]
MKTPLETHQRNSEVTGDIRDSRRESLVLFFVPFTKHIAGVQAFAGESEKTTGNSVDTCSDNRYRSFGFPILPIRYLQEIATQSMLIIEVWTNHETSLGWTRYTPRIYLSFVVMLLMKQCCILL